MYIYIYQLVINVYVYIYIYININIYIYIHIYTYMVFITQQIFDCRVPGGLCYGWAMGLLRLPGLDVHATVLVFRALCDTCSRLAETEWSPTRVFVVEHKGLDNFYLQDASGPSLVALAFQTSPQSLPGMSQTLPRCFPDASQMSEMHPETSHPDALP